MDGRTHARRWWIWGVLSLSLVVITLAAAVVSLGLTTTGSFGHIETHELFRSQQIAEILGVARATPGEAVGTAA